LSQGTRIVFFDTPKLRPAWKFRHLKYQSRVLPTTSGTRHFCKRRLPEAPTESDTTRHPWGEPAGAVGVGYHLQLGAL